MTGRQLRTALHLAIPSRTDNNLTKPLHKYKLNESVFAKNFERGERWMSGKL